MSFDNDQFFNLHHKVIFIKCSKSSTVHHTAVNKSLVIKGRIFFDLSPSLDAVTNKSQPKNVKNLLKIICKRVNKLVKIMTETSSTKSCESYCNKHISNHNVT